MLSVGTPPCIGSRKRGIGNIKSVVLLTAAIALSSSSYTAPKTAPAFKKWCFVVAGDGRSDNPGKRTEDKDGVNALITGEMAQAVLDEKAKFLMWTGDLVHGYEKDPAAFEKQLLAWRGIMAPLYDKHIPVLACRGNHDASSTEAERVWDSVFTGSYAMPQNGPATEKNLSFYVEEQNVLAIGLDQYKTGVEQVNQPWLDDVLAKHKKPFIFAMGHEPAFMDGRHADTMDSAPNARDIFWKSLINAGARVFFCGHDHLYDHMTVTQTGTNPGPVMHQFVAGTSGAPFYNAGPYSGNNTIWSLKREKSITKTYGYMLVEIDGKKATITFKGRVSPGHYEPMDTFSYSVP